MKRLGGLIAMGLLMWGSCPAWARPVDLSAPSNGVGAANLRGYLEIWTEIDEIDFGKDLTLPLRFKFSSEKSVRGILGEGFWLPIVEANAVLIRPRMMRVTLPCGKALYLVRNRKDQNRFQTSNFEWNGVLSGDEFRLSRDDGWELKFKNGRLSSLQTDAGRQLKWTYSGASKVSIAEGGNQAFKLEIRKNEIVVIVNGRTHLAVKGKRPHISVIAGRKVMEGFEESLSTWKWPDGNRELFEFSTTGDLVPKLFITDRKNSKTDYTWDPNTGYISSEGGWMYEVGKISEKFGVPSVHRTNSKGQREGMSIDVRLGIYKRTNIFGMETVTYTSKERGPSYGKVLKAVEKNNDREIVVYSAKFDESGRLIREVDKSGTITTLEYGKKGDLSRKIKSPPTDPDIVEMLAIAKREIYNKIENTSTDRARQKALVELAMFYIHKDLNPSKALELLPKISNRRSRFSIQLHAVYAEGKLELNEKLRLLKEMEMEFPERAKFINKLSSRISKL